MEKIYTKTLMGKKIIILVVLFFSLSTISKAQDVHKFQSIFIYNFSKFIQWPAEYENGEFVIGVLGDSPITKHLESMASVKKVRGQKFVIKKFSSVDKITKCHMLYIPSNKSASLQKCLAGVGNNATLIITDKPGLAENGSGINFLIVDGKPKFELNKTSTTKHKLKVSTQLSKLAILI